MKPIRIVLLMTLSSTLAASYSEPAYAQRIDALSPQVRKYVSVSTPKVILEHVVVIDGTGAPPLADQNVAIEGGKITAISPGADQPPSDGTTIINLRGHSVMPGIVGMHDHLFCIARPNLAADNSFDRPGFFVQMRSSCWSRPASHRSRRFGSRH